MSEELFFFLQSLVMSCQSLDFEALLETEKELWPLLSAEQKQLLRILVQSTARIWKPSSSVLLFQDFVSIFFNQLLAFCVLTTDFVLVGDIYSPCWRPKPKVSATTEYSIIVKIMISSSFCRTNWLNWDLVWSWSNSFSEWLFSSFNRLEFNFKSLIMNDDGLNYELYPMTKEFYFHLNFKI